MSEENLNQKYLEYAEFLSELSTMELRLRNVKRIVEELRSELSVSNPNSDGSYAIDMSAHAFKQLCERLEGLALEFPLIYADVFKDSKAECLLLPSNLKSFIIALLANAKATGTFVREPSKNSNGFEWRYTIDIKKWSNERNLQLICIVENGNIKTGYFNML